MARFNLADLLSQAEPSIGCLLWSRAKSKAGYGQVWDGSKVLYVHRLVAEFSYGEIPKGMDVMHSCDVRACCNPSHLSIGTRSENMKDASRKGRLLGKPHVSGENHPSSRLTTLQIEEMRKKREQGYKLSELAQIYNYSIAAISKILRGETRTNG